MSEINIKQKTIAGAFWKFLERFIAQGVTVIVSIIIARILDPSDYSVVSIVTIFFTFANLLITGGLNTALIQKKNADPEDYSTVLVASFVMSLICYAILFFAAPVISRAYDQPLLIPIFRVMGISLIITAIKSVWCAYISSHLEFKKFFKATIGGTLISAVVGIVMALAGTGAWALVAQQMTNTIIDTIILMLSVRVRFAPRFSFNRFKPLFGYSWKILLSSLIGTVYSEMIPLFIGLKYSASDLSFYTKGRQFPANISSTVTNTLSAILFPALAKVQDEKERLLKYTRMFIGLTSFVVFPMMLGFFAVADKFVVVVLTAKWNPAVYYMRVFCFACMFNMIHLGNCETIKAMGRSDIYLKIEIIKKVCYFTVIALFLFCTSSPEKLVLAFVVNEVVALIVNSVPNVKLIGYKVVYQLADLLPNLITSGIMATIVYLIGKLPINNILLLFIQVITGGVLYILMSILIKNKNFYYLLNLIKEKRKKSA